jgi:hypothetical protein
VGAQDLIKTLIGVRLTIGAGSWLMPRLGGRLFGLDARENPQLPYVLRLFGVRDVALAGGLVASEGEPRALWLRMGVACDAADALAGLAAGARGELGPFSSALVTAAAMGAGALGAAALRTEDASAGGSSAGP